MSLVKFLFRSLWHYRRLNLTVVAGVALSTAILLGALIIGDSVRFSLQEIVNQRLGTTSRVISAGERLFRIALAGDLSASSGIETTPLLRSNGMAIINGGKSQFNHLAVWGVQADLGNFSGQPGPFVLNGNEAAINENLAQLTGLKTGDEFLLRVNKLNTFPANTPFVSADEASISFQVVVKRIVKAKELGNLNLLNSQSPPKNVFLNLDWINTQMQLKKKANVILVKDTPASPDLTRMLQKSWKTEDLNLIIRQNASLNYTEVISDRVFIDWTIEQFCERKLAGTHPVFSYFINDFAFRGGHTPYSFISTSDSLPDNQIMVSQWLADDLKLKTSDSLRVSYFRVGPLRNLEQRDTTFITGQIYQMEGRLADPELMPVIPGLSDAKNCRDWKTGVPVDLKKIRLQDESYWKKFKGTPKAIVSLRIAKKLWGNRFGQATSIRFDGNRGAEVELAILNGIAPYDVGFGIQDVRSEGLSAATNGVDFGQLFLGLSFFVLTAAFLLTCLLFKLFLQYRTQETKTLGSIGLSSRLIRKILFSEAIILVIIGVLAGIPLGIVYNNLILRAINTIWFDIVRTSIAQVSVQPGSIIAGSFGTAAGSILLFYFVLNRFLIHNSVNAQEKKREIRMNRGAKSLLSGIILMALSLILIALFGFNRGEINPDLFFAGGFLMLPGLILLLDFLLIRFAISSPQKVFSFRSLVLKRLSGERKLNLMAVAFLSIGIFLVVSTGLYRKEAATNYQLPSSGTGGFDYFIETTLPVLFDPGTKSAKSELGLPDNAITVPFQVQPGDDASCLNLNRITRPRIIACNPATLSTLSAFSFSTWTEELDKEHPWLSLNKELSGQAIPVFADQSVIQWSLGKSIGDTLTYRDEAGNPLLLKLIGGLENSVFQGNIIMAEDHFTRAFPSVSGAGLFLLSLPGNQKNGEDFREDWRRYGAEITATGDRLQAFSQIENTYLNIFLMLGALGLLVGTAGLSIILFRTTLEKIHEFALMQSVGFSKPLLLGLLLTEKMLLVFFAVLVGSGAASLSALPLLASSQAALWIWIPLVSLLVLTCGLLSILVAVRMILSRNLILSLGSD